MAQAAILPGQPRAGAARADAARRGALAASVVLHGVVGALLILDWPAGAPASAGSGAIAATLAFETRAEAAETGAAAAEDNGSEAAARDVAVVPPATPAGQPAPSLAEAVAPPVMVEVPPEEAGPTAGAAVVAVHAKAEPAPPAESAPEPEAAPHDPPDLAAAPTERPALPPVPPERLAAIPPEAALPVPPAQESPPPESPAPPAARPVTPPPTTEPASPVRQAVLRPAPRSEALSRRQATTGRSTHGAPAAAGDAGTSPVQTLAAASDAPILVTAPRYRRPPRPPDYPPHALDLGLTGTVLVRALVSPEGDTRETRIWRSSGHPSLDAAAVAAVRRWAFEPARTGGRPVPAWVEVPVHFRLH
jgi:protein TonB